MKINYSLVTCIGILFTCGFVQAQNIPMSCGTIENSPIHSNTTITKNNRYAKGQNTIDITQAIPDTIQVVFHVLYSSAAMNIPDSMIMKQLHILNEDFPRLNADTSNTPGPFKALSGALPVRFALAQHDSSGAATTGIVRVPTTHGPFGFNTYFDMTHTANGGNDKWDSRYLNIYVAEMSGSSGVGWMGSNISLLNYQVVGNSRVGTHEIGHVFGLSHIWGPEQSTGGFVCSSDDGIADTPEQWSPVTYCGSFPLFDTCTNTGNGIMYMNFMNYNVDACVNMFSVGQVASMTDMLNTTLNDLINNVQLSVSESTIAEIVSIFPNPGNGLFQISIPDNSEFELKIFNSVGQQIMIDEKVYRDYSQIKLSSIPGIYFCHFTNSQTSFVKKVIVE